MRRTMVAAVVRWASHSERPGRRVQWRSSSHQRSLRKKTLFNLPVIADRSQELRSRDRARIDAGQKVARVGEPHGAISSDDIAVHAERDLTAGEAEGFANVLDVI